MKLPKTYDPHAYEPQIYSLWETAEAFAPAGDPKKGCFSIALPPPNANGDLHVGHALTVALQDTAIRYHRLKGESAVYLPGADHAGFETWVVYERMLDKQGKSRFDFSRGSLYGMVWDFVEQQRGNMEIQLRELGASLDWNNLTFTLDKKVIDITYDTFKKLWDDGLVYRGKRIVNFCTTHQTSFADIEVEHAIEKTKLWSIAYTLVDKVGEIVIATTRPETLLGDTAIAVNPADPRYKHLVGTHAWVPLTNREIPIIADSAIDPAFGTGAIKVTPAHDPVDFEISERHTLPVIEVIGTDGTMTETCPPQFAGLKVTDARTRIIAALQVTDALRGEQTYSHAVGHCYKCGTIIQPLIKDQWFLKVKPLAKKAIAAIKAGNITFFPASKGKVLINYLNDLKDWNLSRQIPWGIPIPAFQNSQDHNTWVFDRRVDQPAVQIDGVEYHREEDTFDTWFSSGQWPYITTDALTKGPLAPYYPLSVMETGGDILFPWVSRMIMLGLYRTGKVPFKAVYLHGLVLDEHSKKMSKSKGNVINPQKVIKQYGSDALRMGLIANRSPGVDQAFSTGSVIAGRNFANKLWNIVRYTTDALGDTYTPVPSTPETPADHWIIDRLNNASVKIGSLIEAYRFAEAYEHMYHTVWDDVADWYIESSKSNINNSVLAYVTEAILTLAHPFAPFVTETIWQTLKWRRNLLIQGSWPVPVTVDLKEARIFSDIQTLVNEIRFVGASLGAKKHTLLFTADDFIEKNSTLIQRLARLKNITRVEQGRGMRLAVPNHETWLDIDKKTLYEHQSNLEMRLVAIRQRIALLETRLNNTAYAEKAPVAVVTETRTQHAEQKMLEQRLIRELDIIASA